MEQAKPSQHAGNSAARLETLIKLKRTWLRAALAISGGANSGPDATEVAGAEAAALKREIASLEQQLGEVKSAA